MKNDENNLEVISVDSLEDPNSENSSKLGTILKVGAVLATVALEAAVLVIEKKNGKIKKNPLKRIAKAKEYNKNKKVIDAINVVKDVTNLIK